MVAQRKAGVVVVDFDRLLVIIQRATVIASLPVDLAQIIESDRLAARNPGLAIDPVGALIIRQRLLHIAKQRLHRAARPQKITVELRSGCSLFNDRERFGGDSTGFVEPVEADQRLGLEPHRSRAFSGSVLSRLLFRQNQRAVGLCQRLLRIGHHDRLRILNRRTVGLSRDRRLIAALRSERLKASNKAKAQTEEGGDISHKTGPIRSALTNGQGPVTKLSIRQMIDPQKATRNETPPRTSELSSRRLALGRSSARANRLTSPAPPITGAA